MAPEELTKGSRCYYYDGYCYSRVVPGWSRSRRRERRGEGSPSPGAAGAARPSTRAQARVAAGRRPRSAGAGGCAHGRCAESWVRVRRRRASLCCCRRRGEGLRSAGVSQGVHKCLLRLRAAPRARPRPRAMSRQTKSDLVGLPASLPPGALQAGLEVHQARQVAN